MAVFVKCPSETCGRLMPDPTEYVTVAALDDLREYGLLQWPPTANRISGYQFQCVCGTTLDVPLAAPADPKGTP